MKKNSKRLLAAVIALMMVLAMVVPAMATGTSGSETDNKTQVQITKKLKIGQGITVPDETFTFTFAPATATEADDLGVTGSYIVQGATQAGGGAYPALADAMVAYNSEKRTKDGTDEELTFMSGIIDLSDSSLSWAVPGLYVYSVKETQGSNTDITYDTEKYFLKVYVKNGTNGNVVDSAAVYGKNENGEWVKIDGAPTEVEESYTSGNNDGCKDYTGNDFIFTNAYKKLTDEHPTNPDPASGDEGGKEFNDHAFKLTKVVSGNYANQDYGFDFEVTVKLPETYADFEPITAVVNGYTINQINGDTALAENVDGEVELGNGIKYDIFLKHGDSFSIKELPAGTMLEVKEKESGMKYVPNYSGKWGGDLTVARTGSAGKGEELASDTIVVGENGAYIEYTNTLNDSDVTATGIAISNLPYILMVVIAMAGIGFFMVSKKRRNG